VSDDTAIPRMVELRPDTPTMVVSTERIFAYQTRVEERLNRQKESINRILGLLEDCQQREAAAADEIAHHLEEIGRLTEALRKEEALRLRAEQERDEVLRTFAGMQVWLKDQEVKFHTRDGETVATKGPIGESYSIDPDWDRAPDLDVDPEDVVRNAPSTQVHVGEERPGRHLAGE